MVNDHLDGKSIVDIHEEGISHVFIKTGYVHFSYAINKSSVVGIFTGVGAGRER